MNIKKALIKLGLIFTLVGFSSVATSHHSFSPFNMETIATIKGEIVDFEWTNPHTWVWVNVSNPDGSITQWGLEGMSPNYLGRRGWSKRSFQPGDQVTLDINPLRSGEPGGMLNKAILEDGSSLVMFGSAE